jgi:hypothetical protein
MSSSQATTLTRSTGGLTIFSLSGELRNKIYRAHFDNLYDDDDLPKIGNNTYATAVRSFLKIFEASKIIHKETHGLFFAEYFPRIGYALQGLRAIQAFVKLPSDWKSSYHMLEVGSKDADVGLEYLSTLNAVFEGTLTLESQTPSVSHIFVAFQGQELPYTDGIPCPFYATFDGIWDEEWRKLALSRPIYMPEERDARLRRLPNAFIEADHHRTMYSNSGEYYYVYLGAIVDNVGSTKWLLAGNLSNLDWSYVPEDLSVFVDKPRGDAITDATEKAVRIIKGLRNDL